MTWNGNKVAINVLMSCHPTVADLMVFVDSAHPLRHDLFPLILLKAPLYTHFQIFYFSSRTPSGAVSPDYIIKGWFPELPAWAQTFWSERPAKELKGGLWWIFHNMRPYVLCSPTALLRSLSLRISLEPPPPAGVRGNRPWDVIGVCLLSCLMDLQGGLNYHRCS